MVAGDLGLLHALGAERYKMKRSWTPVQVVVGIIIFMVQPWIFVGAAVGVIILCLVMIPMTGSPKRPRRQND